MTLPRIHVELIPLWFRKRSQEANGDLERERLGETSDEQRARAALYGKRRREFLTGASGGGWRRK